MRRKRLSINTVRDRHEAAHCARQMALPSIRWPFVLRYWRDLEKTYGYGRWRWARALEARP